MSSPPHPPSATSSPPSASPTEPPLALPAPRKFPAPCWTQDETLALIKCYQDKWYSLRRRNLRTADWEAVAEDVSRRCPNQSSPKTSAQCRHKMEKLRKRYRTEKQRFLSIPNNNTHRFFPPSSSWVFFDLMDSMETGTPIGAGGPHTPHHLQHQHQHQHPHVVNVVPHPTPPSQHQPPTGIPLRAIPFNVVDHGNGKPDVGERSKSEFNKYFDEILMGITNANARDGDGGVRGPMKFKIKNHQQQQQPPQHQHQHQHHAGQFDDGNNDDGEDGYYVRSAGSGMKRKYYEEEGGFDYEQAPPMRKMANGGSKSGVGVGVGVGSELRSSSRDSLAEMVESIKMLGEGLVKVEKMKMEMMREMETMRMEMEMKKSQMILESQQLIVNAFVQGLKNNNNNNNNNSNNNNKVVKLE